MSLAFEHVNVLTSTGEFPGDQTVFIEGDRIASVEPTPRSYQAGPTPSQLLTSILWDMHVHLSYTKASALPILLGNGVTGVRDCGGFLHELDEWQSEIQLGTLAGPKILRVGPQVNSKAFAPVQIARATINPAAPWPRKADDSGKSSSSRNLP